jgi:FkbM family methyltransferase
MVLEQQQEQEKEFALCLNMIVKNESHIIKDKLTKLLQKIKFDYWVISDTGSTDKTKEIITDFFKEVGIPGEIYEDDWVDFAHNRNRALEYAFGKSKYLLVFDADDEICGDFVLPELTRDSYSLQFGSYTRPQIVNNRKRWKYVGVLHEYICSADSRINDANTETIKGPYHVISGRSGNRNLDSNKYLKDAIILEKAYNDAVNAKDDIHIRYGFYCANSYYDCGKYENAISWYKKTLENGGWAQEKYVSCLKLYNCYDNLDKKKEGFFYLIKSAEYDRERAECYYELIKYYSGSGLHNVAHGYYGVLRDFYRDTYLNDDLNNKLFVNMSISEFHLPYYVIIVCEKMRDYDTGIHMYRIIFTKKCKIFDKWLVGNMLYNLQFFTEHVKEEDKSAFYSLFQEYVDFLIANNYPLSDHKHEFMKTYEKYGIVVPSRFESVSVSKDKEECSRSKKILFYSGFAPFAWNYTYSTQHALGGSETALANLSKLFPSDFEIYVAGNVLEEKIANNDNGHTNVTYVNIQNLSNLVKTNVFHTVIVSRYVGFYDMFPETAYYQSFIWGHDIVLLSSGSNMDVESILRKWSDKITGCVCQTEWHKKLFVTNYPMLKDKIFVINNGIILDKFINKPVKIPNRFIYTSCSERGLERLLKLWPQIIEKIPDAELYISSYNRFPSNEFEFRLRDFIDRHEGVKHVGSLNKAQLYEMMASAEYWLYPTSFSETSCITAMEMLMSEVICIYYPLAGLNNTLGKYGIQVIPGTEIQSIMNLSEEKKTEMKINGKEYAMSCSWENRAKEWAGVLGLNTDSELLFLQNLSKNEKRMFYLYETISMPQAHTNILKKISETFTPNVIYDIGASTLHWTKAAKNIWPNSEFCAFDAIEEVEKLYKSENIKYNIGVISDQDNKIVKFYENKENPAGNSYYKEIGHPNSVNVYPENSYIERKSMTLETVVKRNNFLLPDLVKIDVQGAELDILKGGQTIINKAKYLIIELQNVEYNRGAPLENVTIEYLQSNGWEIVESKFSNNGPDADYLFINTNYRADKILNNDYIIKIVNLERRSDRKTDMINKLSEKMVNNYEFFEAVDGNVLEPSVFIKNLFKNNDFNYRKGVIGCALSHYELWNNLINDDKYSYYVILEDDIELVDNFNEYIEQSISIIQKQDIKYALIGGYQIKDKLTSADIISFDKITTPICSGAFGYIISKEGCKVLVNYLNKNGINTAIDHSDLYTSCLDMYRINKYIVNAESLQIHGNNDTDIQFNYDYLKFENIPTYTVSFVDWWSEEYCGGTFDVNNNFFIKLLSDFYDIKVVPPEENPDILFYSVFGNNHLNLNAGRKVFYSGEAIPQDTNADFNITFDNDNDSNCRLPLWLCYLNDTIINDYTNKINYNVIAPKKSKFCSIICQQDNVENTRSEIVNKLSKYKRVDCGGKFMNNIGYVVPRGINCSGKIEHNNNYKFVIAFENKDYPGYVTEKICDAYKSKCIPIYWGTKDVVKDFNPNTFINANDFVSMDELVEFIIMVDNNDKLYASYFKEPILISYWMDIIINKNNHYFKDLAQNIVINNKYYSANIQSTEYLSLSSIVDNMLTDKNTRHSYLELYESIMHKNKFTAKNILEIGIDVGGSMKLWNDYFINATIYGLDINESPNFLNKYPRINTFKINAYTIDSVNYFVEKDIKFDFIIDDGPHTLESMIFTLIHYSKLLTPQGVLIIEDIQSIEWAYLFEKITNKYKENTHIYDLRENKGRYDDIVFTFTNSNIENIEFIDYNIEYGLDDNKINITHKVMSHSLNKEFIEIPTDDVLRAELYGDICWGVVKSIYITTKDGSVTKCKDNYPIILDWKGILIKKPNFLYKLSACLLIKNETENLNDWIEHYINEGVEHFFITSNNSTDGIDNFISNSEYKNMITLITDNSDINIYNDQLEHRNFLCKNFYNIIKNSTEWCILVDIDEFMYGKNGYTLSSFIDTLDEDIGCFYVYWNIFKPTVDSENKISDQFSLKKSCKRINLDLISDLSYEIKFASKFGKSIFRTSMLQDHTQLWIHKVLTSGKIITNYGNISNYNYDNIDDICWSEFNYTKVNICLNHYAIRNKKDYNNKSCQLENKHRYPFVKGLLDICELDNKYIIEDDYILKHICIQNNTIFKIGFYDNGLSERGTSTMMFSYADYAEKYFKCKSIIFYNRTHYSNNNEVIDKFRKRFVVYDIDNFDEINNIIVEKNIKYFYNTCAGKRNCTELVKNCKNLIHAVFDIEPFGDIYAGISDYIVKKSKYPDIDAIPYMIDLPIHNENMRHELILPDNAFIIGRIGGYKQFDVPEAHNAIIKFLNSLNDTNPVNYFISKINTRQQQNSNNKNHTYKNETNRKVYFVFVNTNRFYEHPQIIYLDKIIDPYLKVKYINTCNCMIHARSDGETFGLAVGEFSSLNKPIITCRSNLDNCHLEILGDKAIIFDSTDSLITILENIQTISNSRDDWNTYKEYTPEKVMTQFKDVFLSNENMYL